MAINRLPDNIIVIAASGNVPDCDRVTFPAWMPRVMCIFATTAGNKSSSALNPPPLRRGYNFAILGEAVQPNGNWDGPRSGTSYAAAIAAGFAGILLQFSWQPLSEGEHDPLNLEGHEKMKLIFEALSMDYRDRDYDCVCPAHLLLVISDGLRKQEQRQRIRSYLSSVILIQRR